MRSISKLKNLALAVGLAVTVTGMSSEAYASVGCTALNGSLTLFNTLSLAGSGFNAGDVITMTLTNNAGNGGSLTLRDTTTNTVLLNTSNSTATYTVPSTTTDTLTFFLGTLNGQTGTVTCVSAAVSGGTTATTTTTIAPPAAQIASNAQAALANAQQVMQNYTDWAGKAVTSSFALPSPRNAAQTRPAEPTAAAKAEVLARGVRELEGELAELRARPDTADDEKVETLERELATARRDLRFALVGAELASKDGVSRPMTASARFSLADQSRGDQTQAARQLAPTMSVQANESPAIAATRIPDGPTGDALVASNAPPALHFNARDLAAFCDAECDVIGPKWNVWAEGRVVGAVDSLAQTNALGFVGSSGADYKVLPWLALGMSVGVESFETKFGTQGVRSGTTGLSAMPYAGFRLQDNVFLTAFAGISSIAYNNNPASGVTAQFQATRLFFGGALTGVWRDGPWRLQPTLSGTYGSENQNGYTDSIGNVVPGQTVTYGRISAGPEVGYTFADVRPGLSVEPFVTGRGNVDFSSSTVALFNGTPIVVRSSPLGSGSLGAGVGLQFQNGFYLRALGSYESIGVSGLDIWSGVLRGGITF